MVQVLNLPDGIARQVEDAQLRHRVEPVDALDKVGVQVEHIEPCALVFDRMGPFVDADGNFTEAARYLNRLANLQLMDAYKNNQKSDNFSGVTRRANLSSSSTSDLVAQRREWCTIKLTLFSVKKCVIDTQ